MNGSLTINEAYRAMFKFIEQYYERGGRRSEDIAIMLSGMAQTLWTDGGPNDPAQWDDWVTAVKAAKRDG